MQLKDQIKKNWKVVTAVTAVSAIGITGLAMAQPGNNGANPDAINLNDRTEISQVNTTTAPTIPGVSFGDLDPTNDSPFDSLDTATASVNTVSPTSPISAASPVSVDSPASASVDSP